MSKRVFNGKYRLVNKTDSYMIVEYIYNCTNCGDEVGILVTIEPWAFNHIENGGFAEPLKCPNCREESEVFFGIGSKIN